MFFKKKKIIIYEAPIYRVFADGVVLVKDQLQPIFKKEIVQQNGSFHFCYGNFINFEHDCNLPDDGEAYSYAKTIVQKKEDWIRSIICNPSISEEELHEFLDTLHALTSCAFCEYDEIQPAYSVSSDEYKSMKKRLKEVGK